MWLIQLGIQFIRWELKFYPYTYLPEIVKIINNVAKTIEDFSIIILILFGNDGINHILFVLLPKCMATKMWQVSSSFSMNWL